jgi:hypothetical protein
VINDGAMKVERQPSVGMHGTPGTLASRFRVGSEPAVRAVTACGDSIRLRLSEPIAGGPMPSMTVLAASGSSACELVADDPSDVKAVGPTDEVAFRCPIVSGTRTFEWSKEVGGRRMLATPVVFDDATSVPYGDCRIRRL